MTESDSGFKQIMDSINKSHEDENCNRNLIKYVKIIWPFLLNDDGRKPTEPGILNYRTCGLAAYLLHYSPGDRSVRCVQNLPHQHGLEEGPGNGSSSSVDHVQIHVHTEGS